MKLPFHVSSLFGWKERTYGYALVNEAGIQLIFDVESKLAGLDPDTHSLTIAWQNLESMTAKTGIWARTLLLKTRQAIGNQPDGRDDCEITLSVKREHGDELDEFVRAAQQYRSGQRQDSDDVLDDVRDMLDRM